MMEEGAGTEPSPAGARPKKKSRKTYDLTAADKFWQKHKGRSVPLEKQLEEGLTLYNFEFISFGARFKYWVLKNIHSANSKCSSNKRYDFL